VAGHGIDRTRAEAVVESQFFAGTDSAAAEKQKVPANFAYGKIWIATVIDTFGPGTTVLRVEEMVPLNLKYVNSSCTAPAPYLYVTRPGLPEVNALARIFDYLAAAGNIFDGENAVPVNGGSPDAQAVAGEARINRAGGSLECIHIGGIA